MKISQYRKMYGMNLVDFAAPLQVSFQIVGKIEIGHILGSAPLLYDIERMTGAAVKVGDILKQYYEWNVDSPVSSPSMAERLRQLEKIIKLEAENRIRPARIDVPEPGVPDRSPLKIYRDRHSLKLAEMGEELGVDFRHVSNLERGINLGSPEVLYRLQLVTEGRVSFRDMLEFYFIKNIAPVASNKPENKAVKRLRRIFEPQPQPVPA